MMKSVACVLVLASLSCAAAAPGSARSLAETLARLQQVAFEDPATGDALLRSLRSQAPAAHSFLGVTPEYPFAAQSAYQAASPDVIHINFDVPSHASFVQTRESAKDSDPIGSLMHNYAKIGSIVQGYENSAALNDQETGKMVDEANKGPIETSSFAQDAAAETKPVVEVRLAAPRVAPWDSLISGLTRQREQMESKYMTMFRELFERTFAAKGGDRVSFLQKAGTDSLRVKVSPMQSVDPSVVSMVVENENKRNEQEMGMMQSAISALQAFSEDAHPISHVFAEKTAIADFDVKVGAGSRPFSRFYDSVQRMEQLRRESEDRIREHIVSMMSKLYHA